MPDFSEGKYTIFFTYSAVYKKKARKQGFRAIFVSMRPPFCLFFLLMAAPGLAQLNAAGKPAKNLVPNGSFENYRKPSQDIRRAIPWRQIESVDYYQQPLSNDTTAERGAAQGSCYAGFRFRKKIQGISPGKAGRTPSQGRHL